MTNKTNRTDLIRNILIEAANQSKLNELSPENREQVDVLYKNSNMVVVVPKSYKMCDKYSKNTKWCSRDETMYNIWREKGFLFRFLFPHHNKIRLTWEWDGSFNWGSGGNIPYIEISSTYLNKQNPFDKDAIEQLKRFWTAKNYWHISNEYIYRYIKMIPDDAAKTVIDYYHSNVKMAGERAGQNNKRRMEWEQLRIDFNKRTLKRLKQSIASMGLSVNSNPIEYDGDEDLYINIKLCHGLMIQLVPTLERLEINVIKNHSGVAHEKVDYADGLDVVKRLIDQFRDQCQAVA